MSTKLVKMGKTLVKIQVQGGNNGRKRTISYLTRSILSPPPYFPLENQKNCVPLSPSESKISATCVKKWTREKKRTSLNSRLSTNQEARVQAHARKKCGATEPNVSLRLAILGAKSRSCFTKYYATKHGLTWSKSLALW